LVVAPAVFFFRYFFSWGGVTPFFGFAITTYFPQELPPMPFPLMPLLLFFDFFFAISDSLRLHPGPRPGIAHGQ
jgi:hypothetical protein